MFCTKCGAELEDGAKFCTNCGAQTVFAKTPAPAPAAPAAPAAPVRSAAPETPAPETPAAPQAGSWQQPQQPQAGSWQQPQQPQAGSWQQPQQPQAGSWQQPQQPQANNWQQPQQPQKPPQWQQIQQQWQQQQQQQQTRQQPQQQWQQPGQQQWQQPQQQQTRGGSHAAQPAKRKGKGALIGIIAAVLVVAVGVGGFVWPGFFKKDKGGSGGSGGGISTVLKQNFATPEEYYQAVEVDNADALAAHVSSAYDNVFLSNASSDDISAAGSLKIEPGDKIREILLDALGEQLEQINPGDDLKWLKNIALTYDVSKKDDMGMLNLAVQLNSTDLVHVKGVLNTADGTVYLSVPELSDKYLKTTLEDLNLDQIDLSMLNLGSMMGNLSPEDAEKVDPVVDALPDAKTLDKLLEKYLKEAVDLVEDVEKSTETLTAEGVSEDYTRLVSTITPETVVKIVEKLGPELKEDKDLKKIILEVTSAAGEDGEAKYQEFIDKIDELLNDKSKITEDMTNNLTMTVYLDKSSEVHGRVIDAGDQKLEILMPEKGGQFGLTVRYTKDNEEEFKLFGSGKRSGDKLTGELKLEVGGEYYAAINLDGFDIEKVKDGFLVGAVEVKPTPSLWSKLTEKSDKEIPETLQSLLDTMVIRLDLDTGKDKAKVTLTLTNGTDKLITIAVDGTKSTAKKISAVDGIEPSEWSQDITLDQLEKVVASIEKAGVPQAYTDMIDQALEGSFG